MSLKTKPNKVFISHYKTIELPSDYTFISSENIHSLENNSVGDIFIGDLFDSMSDDEINKTISEIFSKIEIGGKLHIQSLDIEQFCIYYLNKIVSTEYKNMLYSGGKINIQTMSSMLRLINSSLRDKYSIFNKKYVNGFNYYIMIEKTNE